MKRKLFSLIMALIMVLSVIPVMSVSAAEITEQGECGDDAHFVLYDDGKLIIRGTGAVYNLYFQDRKEIKEIEVTDGITEIGAGSFKNCTNLEKVYLPDSVENIGIGAFQRCQSLKEVRLPSGLKNVAAVMFAGCSSLVKAELPDSIVHIDDAAFGGCESLDNIDLPSELKYIGDTAFANCNALTEVNIPDGCNYIGMQAFCVCKSLEKIRLPESISSLSNGAFDGCTALKYVTVLNPECYIVLSEYTIPQAAKIYGYADSTAETYAGENGNEFIAIENGKVYPELAEAKELTATSHGNIKYYECAVTGKTFSDAEGKNPISKESTVIHDEVGIDMPTVPATCTEEGHEGGRMCSICGKVLEAPTVIPIDENAHMSRKFLMENYTAPTCTEEGHYDLVLLCGDCGKVLDSGVGIRIPKAPHKVTDWEITEESTETENGTRTGTCTVCGHEVTETLPLLIEAGSCGDSASYKLYEDGHLVISGTGDVNDNCFSRNQYIKKVTVEDGITGLGNMCFSGCRMLEEAYIADSVKDIGYGAFAKCILLKDIKLPSGLEVLPADMLNFCVSLEKIDLPESLILINVSVFCRCYSLKEINIPSGVEGINPAAFSACTSLEKIELPDSVNYINEYAFADCVSLRYVTVPYAECYIEDDPDTIPDGAKIYGYKNSTAEAYAKKYNRTFIEIKENEVYPEPVEAVPAADKAHGNIAYYRCPVTGKLFSDAEGQNEITVEDTVAHNDNIIIPGKAPTCTETGLTEGRKCSVCGEISVPQEVIAATGHTWDEGVVTKEPTCTEDGEKTYTCSVCQKTKTEVIKATGHTPGEWIIDKEATCTENGLRHKECTVCGETLETEEIAATGHTDADGDGICDNCGENLDPDADDGEGMWFPFRDQILSFLQKIINFFLKLVADMGYVC